MRCRILTESIHNRICTLILTLLITVLLNTEGYAHTFLYNNANYPYWDGGSSIGNYVDRSSAVVVRNDIDFIEIKVNVVSVSYRRNKILDTTLVDIVYDRKYNVIKIDGSILGNGVYGYSAVECINILFADKGIAKPAKIHLPESGLISAYPFVRHLSVNNLISSMENISKEQYDKQLSLSEIRYSRIEKRDNKDETGYNTYELYAYGTGSKSKYQITIYTNNFLEVSQVNFTRVEDESTDYRNRSSNIAICTFLMAIGYIDNFDEWHEIEIHLPRTNKAKLITNKGKEIYGLCFSHLDMKKRRCMTYKFSGTKR